MSIDAALTPRIAPVVEGDAPEKVADHYRKLRALLDVEVLPEFLLTYGRVESFLRDFYMNFKKFVWNDGAINAQTKSLIALATAAHAHCDPWIDFWMGRCRQLGFSDDQLAEAISISATNYMYNTFFKFRDLSGSSLFEGMGVGLRAHTFEGTSLDEQTIELLNTAISNLNACRPCTTAHVEQARKANLSDQGILEAIQCAATMYAAAQFTNATG